MGAFSRLKQLSEDLREHQTIGTRGQRVLSGMIGITRVAQSFNQTVAAELLHAAVSKAHIALALVLIVHPAELLERRSGAVGRHDNTSIAITARRGLGRGPTEVMITIEEHLRERFTGINADEIAEVGVIIEWELRRNCVGLKGGRSNLTLVVSRANQNLRRGQLIRHARKNAPGLR